MIVIATSSTQPNKADCSKYIIWQDRVEKLICVKTEGCGLGTFFKIVYSFRRHIAFLAYGNLWERERSKKNFDISITDFIGFFTKLWCKQMMFYAMAILQRQF